MLLTIDAGNTNVVFAVFDEAKQKRGNWRISTDGRRTADEYAVWLTHLMALARLTPSDVTDAILVSVVPSATFSLIELCRHHFGCDPLIVGDPKVDLGVISTISNPAETGGDRLVNAVGAAQTHEPPLIILDIGTATTFDVVDQDGNYAGGVIAPGPHRSLEALHNAAARLPKVDIVKPEQVIGRGTIGAMQSGLYWGYIGLIEGLVSRIREEYGAPMPVIGTGGLASLFAKSTDSIDFIDTEVTLRGLVAIYERNRAK